eukprot:TRINITY_DN6308_c0_g1_i1.p1 TRINITY_DN6308_c0_g1~~TRINITY_DN6308_c0_g1_i1.p1  ORF type:complete len:178 (-),score=19.23 TRINITY_DN6308_c0_g1_i1:27-560(-)
MNGKTLAIVLVAVFCCLALCAILLAGIGVTIFLLVPREPDVTAEGDPIIDIQLLGQTLQISYKQTFLVDNPNYTHFDIESIYVEVFDSSKRLLGKDDVDVGEEFSSRSTSDFEFKFTTTEQLPPDVMADLIQQCSTKGKIRVSFDATVTAKYLSFTKDVDLSLDSQTISCADIITTR